MSTQLPVLSEWNRSWHNPKLAPYHHRDWVVFTTVVGALVERQGRSEVPTEMESRIIGNPSARFVIVEPNSPPAHAPLAVVLVVPPSAGLSDDILRVLQPYGSAFFIGFEPVPEVLHPDLADIELGSDELPRIDAPGAAKIRARMERGDSFVVVISSDGCANSTAFQKAASGLADDVAVDEALVDLPVNQDEDPENEKVARELVAPSRSTTRWCTTRAQRCWC